MRIRPFEYHTAETIEEALTILEKYGTEIKVIAGGTDLLLAMKQKKILPHHLLNLLEINDLDYINDEPSEIRIGALAKHSYIASHPIIRNEATVLAEATGMIGSWQIRNVATIGGNLCNASPAADSAPPLLALNAKIVIADSKNEKNLPISSFFTGPGTTLLEPDQLLKEIIIPKTKSRRKANAYLKLTRRRGVDLALVGVAFHGELDESGEKLKNVAIAMGGVAPTPIRALEAEAELTDLSYEKAIKKIPIAAKAAVAATQPITDIRATAEYRKDIVDVYVRRTATKVLNILFNKDG